MDNLPRIRGFCKDCKYYDYQDTKLYPGGSFSWGYCHYYIEKDTLVVGEELDLIEYFEVTETHYCGYYMKGKK